MFNKKFLFLLTTTIFIICSSISLAAPKDYSAGQETPNLKDAFTAEQAGDEPTIDTVASYANYNVDTENPDTIIGTIIQSALSFLGVIFLILMIYGGYLWMTAQGNEEQVTKAKNLITAAMIGIVIVVSAYAISYFVISKVTEGALSS